MANIDLENLLYSFYIEYSQKNRLGQIVQEAFTGSSATTADVYIDLYSIIDTIYNRSMLLNKDKTDTVFTSSIINMCAHYRTAFRRAGVNIRFFIINSNNCSTYNRTFINGYNDKFLKKTLNNKDLFIYINNNLRLLEQIIPYLPDIFYINTSFEAAVVMKYLIDINQQASIIITKDSYLLQLIAFCDNTAILRPLKTKSGDESYSIYVNNFWERYFQQKKLKTRPQELISIKHISLMNMLTAVPERGLPAIARVPMAYKVIQDLIKDCVISKDNYIPILDYDICDKIIEYHQYEENQMVLINRFKAVDVNFQLELFKQSPESKTIVLNNLYDPNGLNLVANQYFVENPIELDKL